MRDPENIREVSAAIHPDLMGFIFYNKSPRYTPQAPQTGDGISRVGVFVNADKDSVIAISNSNNLDIVQLHGDESPEYAEDLNARGLRVMKAIRVGNDLDFSSLEPYIGVVDMFLFDAAGSKYGGNGVPFDWKILNRYPFRVPYLVGGGLDPGNIGDLLALGLPGMAGVDLNSGFETSPGLKDPAKLKMVSYELPG